LAWNDPFRKRIQGTRGRMSKNTKTTVKTVKRDEDFEELDQQLEAAMRALESVNEKTTEVLQRVDQGVDVLSETPGAAEDAASDERAAAAPEAPEPAQPETPAEA